MREARAQRHLSVWCMAHLLVLNIDRAAEQIQVLMAEVERNGPFRRVVLHYLPVRNSRNRRRDEPSLYHDGENDEFAGAGITAAGIGSTNDRFPCAIL